MTHWLAVNARGRDTCGTSTLPAPELVAHLTRLGYTRIEVIPAQRKAS